MSTNHTSIPTAPAIKLASLAAILAVVVGSMVLIGWASDIAVLKSVLPGWVAMKANAAACFILIGVALLLTTRPPATLNPQLSIFLSRLARLCGLLAGLIGLLTLIEYIFGWNPGIDQWLIREAAGALGTSDPGRMAPETALCFVLLSVALWITSDSRKTRWTVLASVILGMLVIALALAAMLSYATPNLGPYGWFGLTIMAMHTTILFAVLGMAVIAISWQPDVLQWAFSRNTTVAFACGMAVLVFIGLNTNRSQFWLGETNHKIAYSEEVLADIDSIVTEIIDAQVHARSYAIAGDERFLKSYLEAIAGYNRKIDALRQLIAGSPHQQQQLSLIETKVNLLLRWSQQFIDAPRTGMADASPSKMAGDGEDLQDNLRATIEQIENEHRQFIKELKQESKSVARFSYITIATSTLASLLIFMTVIFRLNFAVNERMQAQKTLVESEEKFRKITESAQDAIIMMGPDQRISFWNAAAEHIFGYTAAEAMGQELHALIVPASAHAAFAQAFPHFQETGEGALIGKVTGVSALRKSGEEFPVELSISATQLNGQWCAISIVRDITGRKKAEEVIQAASQYSRSLIEASLDPLVTISAEGKITDVNIATERATGVDRASLIGSDFADYFTDPDKAREGCQQVFSQGFVTDYPLAIRHVSGKITDVLYNASVYRDGSGNVLGVFAAARDITERKLAESRLAKQLNELRQWHDATLGREMRILDLKHEVNELLGKSGQPPRYPSAESGDREHPVV